MILFLSILFIFILLIIIIFAFPQFSPIPYFPSNKKDKELILKALNIKNDQIIIDLGAGDGWVIFDAAKIAYQKKLNTYFIAVDINPILILTMYLQWFFHPNRKNIKIIRDNIFKINFINFMNFKNFITFYLYISPWHIKKVIENLKLKIKNFSVVSYMYPIKSLKNKENILRGKNKIFIYKCDN